MAVDDLSACSRSFDYMVNDDEGTSSNLPHRKGEVLGNSASTSNSLSTSFENQLA